TLNPEGRTMFWPVPGSNKAVLSSQNGFTTVAASAPAASARNDANATTVVRGYERLTRMRYIPPLVKTYAFSCLLSIGKRTSIMAAATPQLPPDHATALQHRRQSACKDADVILRGHSMAETVNEAHNLFPWFSQEMSIAMVHAPGLLHIGGAAHFLWGYPPHFWGYRENKHFYRSPRPTLPP